VRPLLSILIIYFRDLVDFVDPVRFAVGVPDLDRSRLSLGIKCKKFYELTGLSRLIRLECVSTSVFFLF
jgi:hypothetical protein